MFELLFNQLEPNIGLMAFRLLIAMICGLIIGLEREYRGKAAGLRTYMLICMGSCLFTLVSEHVAFEAKANGITNADPGRIAAQIVTGIGFLGAGAIIRNRGNISGLTTAAGIWGAAAIGLAVGTGMIAIGFISTIGLVLTMESFSTIVKWARPGRKRLYRLDLRLKKEGRVLDVRSFLQKEKIPFKKDSIEQIADQVYYSLEVQLSADLEQQIVSKLSSLKGIQEAHLHLFSDE